MTIRLQWRRIRESRKKMLRCAARFFFAAGCVAIAFCAAWYWQAFTYQRSVLAKVHALAPPRVEPHMDPPTRSEPILEIDVPRVGLSAAVVEGVSAKKLRLAVGHVPGTALPGGSGNVALAGHRDTFFRKLRFVHPGDEIRLATRSAVFDYAVEWVRITSPSDAGPLRASNEAELTLVTCYPFYYVGPAPQRFIVRARPLWGQGFRPAAELSLGAPATRE